MNSNSHSGINYDLYRAKARRLREQALDDLFAAGRARLGVGLHTLGRLAERARTRRLSSRLVVR